MPNNKFQDVIFTIIMATVMVYGMIVYNVALNMGGVTGKTFLLALREMPIMVPIAFVLEFFVVGKIAKMLAFTVMRPDDRPQFITYAISICICCIMCPIMSLIATILFKETKTFGTYIQTLPASASTSITPGRIPAPGCDPAERTWTRSPARCRVIAAAICERPEFCTQT